MGARRARASALAGLGLALGGVLACSSPSAPTTRAGAPSLVCPAPLSVVSPANQPVAVVYPKPTATGGAAPVTSSCQPAQGTAFPLGGTVVTCTITDALSRSASCSFNLTVQPQLTLKASRVLAFGDSITEGKTAAGIQPLYSLTTGCPNDPGRATSYPRVLAASLQSAYAQSIPVTNCGSGGEPATDGVLRLPTAFTVPYDVVLLQEGANDLNELAQGGTQSAAVARVSGAITAMIRSVRPGRTVFVGTLLPQRVGGSRAGRPDWVEPVNERLRTVVPAEGAILVDLYKALGASPDPYIDVDGLHPTVEGHARISAAFLAAIRSQLETSAR